MTPEQKNSIANVVLTLSFLPGETIVSEGDNASSFFLIKEGTVAIFKENKEVRKMIKGDSFGEQALYANMKRGATVKAVEKAVCLALGRDSLTNILGDKIQKIIYRNILKWSFDQSETLKRLTSIQKEKLIEKNKTVNYKKNDVLIQKNNYCNQILIVIEGTMRLVRI